MTYSAGDIKWGTDALGSFSGTVTWSMDLPDGSYFASGYNQNDFEAAMQAAFDRWEDVSGIDLLTQPRLAPILTLAWVHLPAAQ